MNPFHSCTSIFERARLLALWVLAAAALSAALLLPAQPARADKPIGCYFCLYDGTPANQCFGASGSGWTVCRSGYMHCGLGGSSCGLD